MAPANGLEPSTNGLTASAQGRSLRLVRCSTELSYAGTRRRDIEELDIYLSNIEESPGKTSNLSSDQQDLVASSIKT